MSSEGLQARPGGLATGIARGGEARRGAHERRGGASGRDGLPVADRDWDRVGRQDSLQPGRIHGIWAGGCEAER